MQGGTWAEQGKHGYFQAGQEDFLVAFKLFYMTKTNSVVIDAVRYYFQAAHFPQSIRFLSIPCIIYFQAA